MAMKVNYKQLTKAGLVAVLYGLLSAIAVNDFLNVVNSYSTGLLGLSQLILQYESVNDNSKRPVIYFCLAGIWFSVHSFFRTRCFIKHHLLRDYSHNGAGKGSVNEHDYWVCINRVKYWLVF